MRICRLIGPIAVTGLMTATASVRAQFRPTVQNYSFESPSLDPNLYYGSAYPDVPSWNPQAGSQNTGEFINLYSDTAIPGGGTALRITNADGAQLAYIAAQYDPTGITTLGTPVISRLSQVLPTNDSLNNMGSPVTNSGTYQVGKSYTLTVGVGSSSVEPVDADAGLIIALYYVDPNNGGFDVIASQTISGTEATANPSQLQYRYPVTIPAVAAGAPYAGKPIGIMISTADDLGPGGTPLASNTFETGGIFDVDDVVLTYTPEPSAIGFASIGVLGLLRRRRQPK